MKSIPYTKKVTSAATQYRKMRKSDVDWILDQCKQIVSVINTCESGPADLRSIAATLNTPSVLMPKQSTGKRNSTKSMCEGVLDNFAHGPVLQHEVIPRRGTQYDLSDKTCVGVTEAFRQCSEIFDCFEEVEFEEVTALPKISAQKIIPEIAPDNNFSDLFEVETITVVYKTKQK